MIFQKNALFTCVCAFFVVPLQRKMNEYLQCYCAFSMKYRKMLQEMQSKLSVTYVSKTSIIRSNKIE